MAGSKGKRAKQFLHTAPVLPPGQACRSTRPLCSLDSTQSVSCSTAWGVKVCLDPCWGEQWGWLREEGLRQPALGLVCTMHEALARWREEVPALLGCSI